MEQQTNQNNLLKYSLDYITSLYINEIYPSHEPPRTQHIFSNLNEYLKAHESEMQDKNEKDTIIEYSQKYIYILMQIPSVYIEFFCFDFMSILQEYSNIEDFINFNQFWQHIQYKVLNYFQVQIDNNYLKEITQECLIKYINILNECVHQIYENSRQIIEQNMENFKTETKKLSLLQNKYVIIILLKELSKNCEGQIINYLNNTFFVMIEYQKIKKFALFIIQNFELIKLKYIHNNPDINNGQNETILNDFLQEIQKQSKKKYQISEIVNKDGKIAYLITYDNKTYFIQENSQQKFVLINQKYMTSEWQFHQKPSNQDQLFNKFKNSQLSAILKNDIAPPPPSIMQANRPIVASAASDVGSSLGYCLANINNYNSTSEFLQDFGKLATINGSITYIVQQVPVIGTLLLVGGLGYSTLTLFKNKAANSNTKMNQLGKLAIGTGSAITGSLSGAFVGQSLIPIPILGAFIGGVVGGVIGSVSSMWILGKLSKSNFKEIIQKIEKLQKEEGFWEYEEDNMCKVLGIKKSFFIKQKIEGLNNNQWVSFICFLILCVNYQHIENQKKQWLEKKLNECKDEKKRQELEEEFNIESGWPYCIKNSFDWIYNQNIHILFCIEKGEIIVKNIIDQC